MYSVHEAREFRQRQATGARSRAVKRAAQAVIGQIVDVPWDGVDLADVDNRPRCVDELLFTCGTWSGARRAATAQIAGDVAAWIADSHQHIAWFVLTSEIAEWASGLEPEGATRDRLRAYAGVSATMGDDFTTAMMDVVDTTLALVVANWCVIEAVAIALLARQHLLAEDVERIAAGRTVVPSNVVIGGSVHVH